jgi:hypothetical protein
MVSRQTHDTTVAPPGPNKRGELPFERSVKLTDDDWARVSWRPRSAPPPVSPFNFEAFLERTLSYRWTERGWGKNEPLGEVIPARLSKEEAWLWLLCVESAGMEPLGDRLRAAYAAGLPDDQAVRAWVQQMVLRSDDLRDYDFIYDAPQVLRPFLTPFEIAELIVSKDTRNQYTDDTVWPILGFATFIAPQLSEDERSSLRSRLEQAYDEPDRRTQRTQLRLALLATVGGGARLAGYVAGLPDGAWGGWHYTPLQDLWRISRTGNLDMLAGLADEASFVREVRRLGCKPRGRSDLRLWLAATEWREVDIASEAVIAAGNKDEAAAMAHVLGLVEAPETAPAMLAVQLESKAPAIAAAWLAAHPLLAAVGLVPVAMRQGRLAQAAREHLQIMTRTGHASGLAAAQGHLTPEQAAWLQREILDVQEECLVALERAELPGTLRTAFEGVKRPKVPDWISLSLLPPIRMQGRRLADTEVTAILTALREKPVREKPVREMTGAAGPFARLLAPLWEKPETSAVTPGAALIMQLKTHADLASLDAFAWGLFERWQTMGAVSKDRWAMAAVGQLGGADCVMKLTPLLRRWPGEGQHARAVFGLSCLRQIGSDTALTALSNLAGRVKSKSLQRHAREMLDDIAQARGLTPEELADRVVPDCDLDERGRRVFDFGPRQFHFVLGPGLKPLVRDAAGKVRADLPTPAQADDPSKAASAVAQWKLLKKTLREVLKLQVARLEDAMVSGRRWSPADFRTRFLQHPLMVNLVRQLVLAVYDDAGKVASTFRVTEDQTFADHRDEETSLPMRGLIGVAHPVHLDEAARVAWGQVLGDYKIVAPFPQIGRDIHRPDSQDLESTEITRHRGPTVRNAILNGILEGNRWSSVPSLDNDGFLQHFRHFPQANVTAFIRYTGLVSDSYPVPEQLEGIFFVTGEVTPGYSGRHDRLKIRDVDPVVLSEVLRLAQAIVSNTQ